MHSKHIQTIFRQSTRFVEGNDIKLSTDINSLGADTEDVTLPQPRKRKASSNSQRCRKGGRHNDGDQVESAHNDKMYRKLSKVSMRKKNPRSRVHTPILMKLTNDAINPRAAIPAITPM